MNNNLSSTKVIFFDTTDTLYKNDELEAAYPQRLAELIADRRRISVPEAKQLLKDTTEKLKLTEKHVTKVRAAAELGISRADVHDAFSEVNPHDYLNKDSELVAALQKLSQQYKLGIISNLRHAHMLEVFDALGISSDIFSMFVTEDVVQEVKPASEPFMKAIDMAGCPADECLYVGDSPTKDMQPAKEAGMKTVLVKENYSNEDLADADGVIKSVTELPSLL